MRTRSSDRPIPAALALIALFALPGCGLETSAIVPPNGPTNGGSTTPDTGGGQTGKPTPTPTAAGANIMSVTVNGSLCGNPAYQYANEPCVSITLCAPGTSKCQTIPNLLLDTGSYGLRIFASVITVPLTPLTAGAATIADCAQFGDGSSEWGPVEMADVQLGAEPRVLVPIEVINSTYSTPPAQCGTAQSTPDTGPTETGFNGILGVGLGTQDCGQDCVTDKGNQQYYACTGSSCIGTTVSLADQVQNPVALLPTDNNGVILKLPSVGINGAPSANGSLILGIGTQADNTPSGVSTYTADAEFNFSTQFNAASSTVLTSFIDSGSSTLLLPNLTTSPLPDCSLTDSSYAGLFCPNSVMNFTAINMGVNGTSRSVGFSVGNAYNLFNSSNSVFSDVALNASSDPDLAGLFDWGLPFFFGKSVYVGFETKQSSLGTGPYWAY